MARAKKLKSGNYRCLVYDFTDSAGKRKYKSFTAPTKKEAEYKAAQYLMERKEDRTQCNLTFGQAVDQYIASRESVLSASTVREYKRMRKSDFADFEKIKISDITQEKIQEFVNMKAKDKSPKTVRCLHGIITAVLGVYRPEMAVKTTLPQKVPPKLYIPTDDDIKTLLEHIDDEDMMIAVLLAAFGPLRRSEICGLEDTDFNGNVAHIQRAVVMNDNHEWIDKTTKSTAGDRFVPFPDFVCDRIKDRMGRIVHINPNQITSKFINIMNTSGLPHFRFHDLRHYCASIQHALGIPDAYIMQRGGWNSDTVLKQVYRHALSDRAVQMNAIANDHFNNFAT